MIRINVTLHHGQGDMPSYIHDVGYFLLTLDWYSIPCCTCPNRIPQFCHAQPHFGRGWIGDAITAHCQELLPNPHGGRHRNGSGSLIAGILYSQGLAPNSCMQDRLFAEDPNLRSTGGNRFATSMERDQATGGQAPHHDCYCFYRTVIANEPGSYLAKIFAGQIGNGVEQVCACVEEKATAREARL